MEQVKELVKIEEEKTKWYKTQLSRKDTIVIINLKSNFFIDSDTQ